MEINLFLNDSILNDINFDNIVMYSVIKYRDRNRFCLDIKMKLKERERNGFRWHFRTFSMLLCFT